jgi:hypothetical protein
MILGRHFLLLLTLMTPIAGVMPASAQSIPDFSGIWAHPVLPGFEPPLSGPGPVLNTARRPDGRANWSKLVGDHGNPILKPNAVAVVKRHGEVSAAGIAYPTPANQCWPQPVPYILWNLGFQMLQQPGKVTLLYAYDHESRQVRLNAAHPPRLTPSYHGDSVGRYEGDTLVIDTVGIRTDRPHPMIDVYGTPYSPALHVVERYRHIDYEAAKAGIERDKENQRIPNNDLGMSIDENYHGKGVELHVTVEDDGVFTTPWTALLTYRRSAARWPEAVCSENRHEYFAGTDTASVPEAAKPDF